jgi:peptide-methionine (S)-S-oxide reductase
LDLAALSSEIATFASGCFWGTEHIFLKYYPPAENKGILRTSVGYTGGDESTQNPSYKAVCTGTTNHAESVKIEFDPSIVPYDELVGTSLLYVLRVLVYVEYRILLPHT